MAITPVNIGRVSQNMQSNLLLQGTQRTLVNLLHVQEQLSTGQQINRPSDDPINATATLRMEETLTAQQQYLDNIDYAGKVMNIGDGAIASIAGLLSQAHDELGLANVQTNLATSAQREAASTLVDSIIGQLVTLGNTDYLGSYIFAGQNNTSPPFSKDDNLIRFTGDLQSLSAQVAPDISQDMSLTAKDVFGTSQGKIVGYQDLAPAANATTRLTDLQGALDQGIRPGSIRIVGSTIGQVTVDITGSATVGDVVQKINAALPAAVQVALTADGRSLQLASTNAGETLRVLETGQGTTAHDLGLYTPVAQPAPLVSADLGVKLTGQTSLTALNGGLGIDLASGLVLTNDQSSITLNFATATTVQDLLNTINAAGIGVKAKLSDDRTSIEIVNQLAGARLTIGENGGSTADDLGIRTLRGETLLTDLNEGLGVNPVAQGNDFVINASNGGQVKVALNGAKTVQDAVDKINAAATAAGVAVTAALATVGNGIVLTDATGGAGAFSVVRDPYTLSNAAEELGILKTADGSHTITGDDVNPTKEESVFTYLIDFREGLRTNDDAKIEQAVAKIETFQAELNKYRGKLGYMAKGLETRTTQIQDAVTSTKALVSTLKDVDYTEAITKFQNLQTTLQANLQVGGQVLNISLLNFLQ